VSSGGSRAVDAIEHIWSVGWSSIGDVEKRHKIAADRLAGKVEAEEAAALYEGRELRQDHQDHCGQQGGVDAGPSPSGSGRCRRACSASANAKNQDLNDPNGDFPPTLRAVTDNTYDKLFKRFTPEQSRAHQARL